MKSFLPMRQNMSGWWRIDKDAGRTNSNSSVGIITQDLDQFIETASRNFARSVARGGRLPDPVSAPSG